MHKLTLLGEFGYSINAEMLSGFLEKAGGEDVHIDLSSHGGSVEVGMTCKNMIQSYPGKVTVRNIGVAFSIASVFMQGATVRESAEGSLHMAHYVSGLTWGTKDDHAKSYYQLDAADRTLLDLYKSRTGKDPEELHEMMTNEVFMTASESVDHGFADLVNSETPAGEVNGRLMTTMINQFTLTPKKEVHAMSDTPDAVTNQKDDSGAQGASGDVVTPTPVTSMKNASQRFRDAFGEDQGSKWFCQEKSFDECVALQREQLENKLKEAEDKQKELNNSISDLEDRLAHATARADKATSGEEPVQLTGNKPEGENQKKPVIRISQ